jgi:type I restriction enzyme S subunit
MREWIETSLGAISTQRKGINYKSEDYCPDDTGHPFITIKCFQKGGGYEPTGIKFYDGESAKADNLNQGDILFSVTDLTRAGDIVGSPLRVPQFGNLAPALASMDCMRITPLDGKCTTPFLYHRLMLADVRRQMVAYAAGSTVLHLDTKKVPSIRVRIPASVSTQKKIATILTTIDTAIEKTEALIEKYQQIKAGLMQDLFTRGVLPNGQLRPPRDQAPELYQETEIGWIPREWQVSELEKACRTIVDCPHSTPSFQPSGVLVARTMHIKNGVFLENEASRVSEKEYQERIARAEPTPGDVILTREAPVGEAFVIPFGMKICLGQRVMLVKPNMALLDSDYLVAQIYSGALSARIAELTAGTTNPHLNVADVRSLLMALPPCQEQQELTRRINAMNAKIHIQQDVGGKLKVQKLGLMQDLLTGKVPVQVDHVNLEVAA